MSLLGSIESSKHCLAHHTRTSARPFLDFLYPSLTRLDGRHPRPQRRAWQPQASDRRLEPKRTHAAQTSAVSSQPSRSVPMDNLFINALLQAGTCRRHHARRGGSLTSAGHFYQQRRRRTTPASPAEPAPAQRRRFSADTLSRRQNWAASAKTPRPEPLTRDEAHSLVVQYDDGFSLNSEDYPGIEHMGNPPEKRLVRADWTGPHRESERVLDREQQASLRRLLELLKQPESSHEELFDLYRELPAPRVPYLTEREMDRLIELLSRVEKHSEVTRLRYMSVLDDLKMAGIRIKRGQWNTAVNMAGKFMEQIDADSVQSALLAWRQMEQEAGVRADHYTFTILFDIATKAEKYILAEKILAEMDSRKLRADRVHRHALIWHYGKRSDGIGVRNVYRELVDAGCIVDTYTLNVVIISLLRANEPSAAEHVFARMKQLHASKVETKLPRPLPPDSWRGIRDLQRILNRLVRPMSPEDPPDAASQHPERVVPVAPDARTYKTLIKYYACHTANFDRVVELLSEMPAYKLPFSEPIFSCLFRAFSEHGGIRYSAWTLERLETVWRTMLKLIDEPGPPSDFRIDLPLVEQALRAFAKCGSPDRVVEVWNHINRRWQSSDAETTKLVVLLRRLVPQLNAPERDRPPVWRVRRM